MIKDLDRREKGAPKIGFTSWRLVVRQELARETLCERGQVDKTEWIRDLDESRKEDKRKTRWGMKRKKRRRWPVTNVKKRTTRE